MRMARQYVVNSSNIVKEDSGFLSQYNETSSMGK
jgi:hypothetical protein